MYEEIKKKPKVQLKRLVEFLECPNSTEEENCGVVDEILKMCNFENLKNLEVNTNGQFSTGETYNLFFRKGEIGDWKNYFTRKKSDKLNHTIEEKFQGSGLKFSYV
uniref:Sulfotransferase n=1 Tax=Solanum lycopersicum TaxID=4081 RepID=A0A3Q7IDC7_SOLLC